MMGVKKLADEQEKGVWETDCGKSHGEAGSREKDDLSMCVKSEITPELSICGTPLWNHNRGFENLTTV